MPRATRIGRGEAQGSAKVPKVPKESRVPRRAKVPRSTKVLRVPWARGFRPPTAATIRAAMVGGDVEVKQVEELEELEEHPALPPPQQAEDWLAQYKEEGQTVASFLSTCPWVGRRRCPRYRGEFQGGPGALGARYPGAGVSLVEVVGGGGPRLDMAQLAAYCAAFLQVPVRRAPALLLEERAGGTPRLAGRALHCRRHGRRRQLATDSLLQVLRETKVATDCLALMAVTMEDLYQDAADLFIAGLAQGHRRVAVFSFYRWAAALQPPGTARVSGTAPSSGTTSGQRTRRARTPRPTRAGWPGRCRPPPARWPCTSCCISWASTTASTSPA